MTDSTGTVSLRVAGASAGGLATGVDAAVTVAGSTGHPGIEPLVVATQGTESRFVPDATEADLRRVVDAAGTGELPAGTWTAEHEPEPATLPAPDAGPLAVGTSATSARCGWNDRGDAQSYREWGIVADEADVLTKVRDAGLLGRGRTDDLADEPIAAGWRTARDSEGEPVVVANANEADEAVAGDELLLGSDPFAVIDGALAAAAAVDAPDLVVCVGSGAQELAERAESAAAALVEEIPDPPRVQVAATPDRFAAAEATMPIESLAGKERIEARRRPPGPAEHGLCGRPTLVHSARTFAQVRTLLADGELAGADSDPGTRLVTISGDVAAPATVELPTDAALSAAFPAVDGAAASDAKAYRVGGRFGGVTTDTDHRVAAGALGDAGLGTAGGVELFGEDRCLLAVAGEVAAFAEADNCGRCVPCREGAEELAGLLRSIYDGEYDAGGFRSSRASWKPRASVRSGVRPPAPCSRRSNGSSRRSPPTRRAAAPPAPVR
jgi:NADH-quinone oxidoreductase subunit F